MMLLSTKLPGNEMISMKRFSRLLSVLLAAVTMVSLWAVPAAAAQEEELVSVLFTHDLHSHFLPQSAADGGESGGYARLKTAIDGEKELFPDALVLDAGDFSIGSLIQTLYTTQAAELRTMGAMGFDATTIGNHEFDHESVGFANMLNAAVDSGETVPAMVAANYVVSDDNPDKDFVAQAMENYGVRETMILERGGVKVGLFGLVGVDSHDCAPTSGFTLLDAAETAERCVAELEAQGAEFIICLSHAGTGESLEVSEDEVLAEEVEGIDLIISGHTHTTLQKPIVVGDTYIVSSGPYCENLGTANFRENGNGGWLLTDYYLTPIDETLEDDPDIAAMVEEWKERVGAEYLERYGLTYDQVLTTAEFDLKTPASGVQAGNNLGELVADSFLWAVEHLEADAPDVQTVSVTADGVLRASLRAGELTTTQAFDVLSMGVGSDGTSGFPLVAVYLTGKELKAAAEVDASVTPIMPAAQLYMGGMEYGFNTNRMFFNRVTAAQLYEPWFKNAPAGEGVTPIADDQLYRVVTGMYSAQMLGTVKSKSMGLLSLEPKMADGTPVTDFNECILRDAEGNEIKEWYALAAYLESFGDEGVSEFYEQAQGDGRKSVRSDWNLRSMVVNLNWISCLVLAVALLLILLVVLMVRLIVRRRRRKKNW